MAELSAHAYTTKLWGTITIKLKSVDSFFRDLLVVLLPFWMFEKRNALSYYVT